MQRLSGRHFGARGGGGRGGGGVGPAGRREVAVEDIPAGPGRTTLKPGEVIAAITLPPRGRAGGDAYLRFIRGPRWISRWSARR